MKKRNALFLAAVFAVSAITLHARAEDKLKVGFVYLGPVGDLGWTFQHDVGRKKMMDTLGDRVDTTYLENVPESADAERSLEQLARSGHQLISPHRSATWSRRSGWRRNTPRCISSTRLGTSALQT
jgi:basic membrane protein A and related proteins